jgi:hypothetical protein
MLSGAVPPPDPRQADADAALVDARLRALEAELDAWRPGSTRAGLEARRREREAALKRGMVPLPPHPHHHPHHHHHSLPLPPHLLQGRRDSPPPDGGMYADGSYARPRRWNSGGGGEGRAGGERAGLGSGWGGGSDGDERGERGGRRHRDRDRDRHHDRHHDHRRRRSGDYDGDDDERYAEYAARRSRMYHAARDEAGRDWRGGGGGGGGGGGSARR